MQSVQREPNNDKGVLDRQAAQPVRRGLFGREPVRALPRLRVGTHQS